MFAQAAGNPNLFLYVLILIGAILLLGVIMQVADNLLRIEARQRNVESKRIGLLPGFGDLFRKRIPAHLEDKDTYVLTRGFDIRLEGQAEKKVSDAAHVTRYALQPPNWVGMAPIPKLHVAVGDYVRAGQPVFFDKAADDVQYVSPVSGEVIEVRRGAKRSIAEIVVLGDKDIQYVDLSLPDLRSCSREDLVAFLRANGGWTLIRERPYDIVPAADSLPANIFISTFDSAPLAPDLDFVVEGRGDAFQKGIDVLTHLTEGEVHLGLDGREGASPSTVFTGAQNVEKHWFIGPHPSGNVGIQIHHVDPIRPWRKVWVLGVQEVITLGAMFLDGRFDARRIIAVTGEPVKHPAYVRTYAGAHIGELLKGNVDESDNRLISGDVLSGEKKSEDGYLNFFDDQVTVLQEGNYYEMFGWLVPSKTRPSVSRTFPNFLLPDLKYVADTNTHGEKRAFVVTGEYEKVLPMDIYPQHLMKAIITSNFERMEGLGIHELSEEDVALCEFACTSKMPLQKILREGLEMMREQG